MRGWRTPFGLLPSPAELLARLVAASVLVLCLAYFFGAPVLRAAAPAVRVAFELIDDDFVVLDLEAINNEGHDVIRVRADLAGPTYLNGYRFLPLRPNGWYQVLITSGGALQGAVVALIALLAWPARSVRRLLIRLAIAVPVVATFSVFDTALSLLGNLWVPLLHDGSPSGFWLSLTWAKVLDGGGRFALAFVLAACIVASVRDRREPQESVA